ncbi:fucolectin-like [Babylonia areolata]|uniref:fucolectin-like n=1 Tax=Babylonia areolata TaxID=304850 RepID=UPI003FD4A4B5
MAIHMSRSCVLFFWYTISALLILDSTCQGLQLTNVALHKPAISSTCLNRWNCVPEKAVDGNKDTYVTYCIHTYGPSSKPHWWRVDLLGLYEIHWVVITNRGDCCGNRLRDFDILVDRDMFNSSSGRQDSSTLCLHHSGPVAQGATVTLNCNQPVTGRYVTVIKGADTDALHFCEIEVLAAPASVVSRSSTFSYRTGERATAVVIKTTVDEHVISCTSACVAEPRCTAVNFKTDTASSEAKGKGICQLLAYTPGTLEVDKGWDFYQQNDARFETEFV